MWCRPRKKRNQPVANLLSCSATEDLVLGEMPCNIRLWLPFGQDFGNQRCKVRPRKEGLRPSADLWLRLR